MPLVDVIQAHVFAAQPIHADDTTVPVLADHLRHWARMPPKLAFTATCRQRWDQSWTWSESRHGREFKLEAGLVRERGAPRRQP
jgi:hypothetical protein